jgi:hypothetical protein
MVVFGRKPFGSGGSGDYAVVRSGEALIHLSAHNTNANPTGSGHVYIYCDDVDGNFLAFGSESR